MCASSNGNRLTRKQIIYLGSNPKYFFPKKKLLSLLYSSLGRECLRDSPTQRSFMNITIKEEILPLTPHTFHILVALAEHHNLTGTDAARQVAADTKGTISMGSGTSYRILERLTCIGMVSKPSAKVYRLTPIGRKWLELEAQRLEEALATARIAM
jgi:DNA-binding MarR family transcriptional regulator